MTGIQSSNGYDFLNIMVPSIDTNESTQENYYFDSLLPMLNVYSSIFDSSYITINEILKNDIIKGNFHSAIDMMFNEIHRYSNILSMEFGIGLDHIIHLPALLQELKDKKLIAIEEWLKLNTHLLILDGINNEVKEFGGSIEINDVEYIFEFIMTINKILNRNCILISPTNETSTISNYDVKNLTISRLQEKLSIPIEEKNHIETTTSYVGVV